MNIRQLIKKLLSAVIFIFIGFAALAQSDVKLVISGTMYVDNMRLPGVNVVLMQEGNVVTEDVSDNNGKFEIEVSIDEQFDLLFEKEEYANKMVAIDGRNVPEDDRKFDFYNKGWKIDMIPLELGVDVSVLKQPVAKLIYNTAEEQFTIDKKYDRQVRPDLNKLAEDVYNAYVNRDMEAEDKFDDYMLAVKDGDLFLKEGDYENAMIQYEAAKELMPEETYPEKQIKKTLALMAENADVEELYAQHLSKGDEAFDNEKWEESKGYYRMALDVKPKMDYPKDQIAKADLKIQLAAQQASQLAIAEQKKRYENQVKKADSLLDLNMFKDSKVAYSKALDIDGKQAYPKAKIKEIDGLIADKNAADKAYATLLANANKFFQEKKFDEAKAAYNQALGINPEDEEPKQKIKEIDVLLAGIAALKAKEEELAKRKAEALEQEYLGVISVADALMVDEKYAQAKAEYERALTIKAGEEYPLAQINDINAKLAAIEGAEKAYQNAMAAAKGFEAKENWIKAKASYEAAQTAKPGESAPGDAIAAIDARLAKLAADKEAAQKAIDEKYTSLIAAADEQFLSKDYSKAIMSYREAQELKDSETYPSQQIAKINTELAKLEGIEKQYGNAMAEAKKYENANKFEEAKIAYSSAQSLKPKETAPAEAIAAIDMKLAQIAADAAAARKAIDDQYAALIDIADEQFKSEKYKEALTSYSKAQGVKKSESYPVKQISKINAKLAEIEGVEKQYNKIIAEAQKKERADDLQGAKTSYNQALKLKPNEQIPIDAIAAIDAKLAQLATAAAAAQKAKDDAYLAHIAKADELFSAENYEGARVSYQEASRVKSNEEYPKTQMALISDRLAAIAAAKAAEAAEAKALAEKQAKYQELVTKADEMFNAGQLEEAKLVYQEARNIDANKTYPGQQIMVVDEKLAAIAAELAAKQKAEAEAKAVNKAYNTALAKADDLLAKKDYENAKQAYLDAKKIKVKETYPDTKIAEIDASILAANQAEKAAEQERQRLAALEEQFNNLLKEGANLEADKNYVNAKYKYEAALKLQPENKDVTSKLRELANKIEEARKLAEFRAKNDTEFNRQLARDYPNGLNETKTEGSKTVTRIVIVDDGRGDEYRKEKYNYGAVFYFKNGKKIDASTFERETKGH